MSCNVVRVFGPSRFELERGNWFDTVSINDGHEMQGAGKRESFFRPVFPAAPVVDMKYRSNTPSVTLVIGFMIQLHSTK